MFTLYLLLGFLIYAATGTHPADPLWDIQADRTQPPRRREILAAIAVWCLALAL